MEESNLDNPFDIVYIDENHYQHNATQGHLNYERANSSTQFKVSTITEYEEVRNIDEIQNPFDEVIQQQQPKREGISYSSSSEEFVPYKITFKTTNVGKRLSSSKQELHWRFGEADTEALKEGLTGLNCAGIEHEVVLVWSIGKRIIYANGIKVYESTMKLEKNFEARWNMNNRNARIFINLLSGVGSSRQVNFFYGGINFREFPSMSDLGGKRHVNALFDNHLEKSVFDNDDPFMEKNESISPTFSKPTFKRPSFAEKMPRFSRPLIRQKSAPISASEEEHQDYSSVYDDNFEEQQYVEEEHSHQQNTKSRNLRRAISLPVIKKRNSSVNEFVADDGSYPQHDEPFIALPVHAVLC